MEASNINYALQLIIQLPINMLFSKSDDIANDYILHSSISKIFVLLSPENSTSCGCDGMGDIKILYLCCSKSGSVGLKVSI